MAQQQSSPVDAPASAPPLYQFEDMRLKPGDRLQVRPSASVAEERQIVRLIGYLDKQSVLITSPNSWQRPVKEGDQIEVRVFLGQGAYGFVCFVDKIIRVPYDYLHLSFPKEVQGLLVRKAPRVKTNLPGIAETAAGRVDVIAANLSATGTLLQSGSALGKEGEEFSLKLPIELYHVKSELSLRCKIKTQRSATESGGDHRTGVEFLDPQPNETMILQSLVHYELVKNPYSVV